MEYNPQGPIGTAPISHQPSPLPVDTDRLQCRGRAKLNHCSLPLPHPSPLDNRSSTARPRAFFPFSIRLYLCLSWLETSTTCARPDAAAVEPSDRCVGELSPFTCLFIGRWDVFYTSFHPSFFLLGRTGLVSLVGAGCLAVWMDRLDWND
ncbi:hypothetical protein BDW42DRAFT_174878 [Aspergillus taichungensis]|uniref:Uncharacterized protein n=1 Tax=Aspergillus taichungensis TaxID=482145 RepID=A0A2J5HMW5_9EURO|nr:hypothetical protein BDW42DRAFT_174878 [Aspergillus taichungensis]